MSSVLALNASPRMPICFPRITHRAWRIFFHENGLMRFFVDALSLFQHREIDARALGEVNERLQILREAEAPQIRGPG